MNKEIKIDKSIISKNWRLINLMSKLEDYQGSLSFGDLDLQSKIKEKNLNIEKRNYRNIVSYKKFNENKESIDPLIPNIGVMGGRASSLTSYGNLVTQSLEGFKRGMAFPISAEFLGFWLCENIRMSKSYRLVFLFEKLAEALLSINNNIEGSHNVDKKTESSKVKSKKAIVSYNLLNNPEVQARINLKRQLMISDPDISNTVNFSHTNLKKLEFVGRKHKSEDLELNLKTSRRLENLKLVGLKIKVSGRILGAEMARSESFKRGQLSSNTIEILKDKAQVTAKTRTGTLGIKLTLYWIKN
jgi:hypothetical protein